MGLSGGGEGVWVDIYISHLLLPATPQTPLLRVRFFFRLQLLCTVLCVYKFRPDVRAPAPIYRILRMGGLLPPLPALSCGGGGIYCSPLWARDEEEEYSIPLARKRARGAPTLTHTHWRRTTRCVCNFGALCACAAGEWQPKMMVAMRKDPKGAHREGGGADKQEEWVLGGLGILQ